MNTILLTILVSLIVVLGIICVLLVRRLNGVQGSYKKALELNQVRLDQQISRINILTRALPNLQSLLSNPQAQDTWKILCLDEGRALIWADAACFWRFLEKQQELILDLVRGVEYKRNGESNRVKLDVGDVGQAASQRVPIIKHAASPDNPGSSELFVPLIVSGHLWGVFQFIRRTGEVLSQREVDLLTMFFNHLALSLENRDLIFNREKFYLELVQTIADTLDSRDASYQGQSRRARELARGMARELDMPEEFTYYLEFAALMHDVGKIAIDDSLLKKPGKLTTEEFEIIKKHPEFGHKILAPVTMLAPVAPMVLYHQEWFNGKGYPEGLSGEEIPLGARIVAILDAWGAMTSDRPWRKALTTEKALDEIRKGAGTQFDPNVVEAFIATVKKQGTLIEK
ncbi:hypothetical protein BVX98_07955 [bacterium F11]|nr:hypothetical protein BVX98_07955 [bacterium F11]